jgi:IS5 family transposase
MPDHPDVQGLVTKARESLTTGDDKEAARLLTDAAYHTHDREIEQQVRELAALGLERAGRFSKGRWKEIIRIADLRAQRSTKLEPDASPRGLSAEAAG